VIVGGHGAWRSDRGGRLCFFDKSIGVSSLVLGDFCNFWAGLDPYFGPLFWTPILEAFLRIAFPGFLTPMKSTLRSPGRSTTHHEPKMHVCRVLGFLIRHL
jgi:hypothetical protein